MSWARFPTEASLHTENVDISSSELKVPYVVQVVRQVNYGPLESKRYFAPLEGEDGTFIEVSEDALIQANFQKLNSSVFCS